MVVSRTDLIVMSHISQPSPVPLPLAHDRSPGNLWGFSSLRYFCLLYTEAESDVFLVSVMLPTFNQVIALLSSLFFSKVGGQCW